MVKLFSLFLIIWSVSAFSGVVFSKFPKHMQLFARNNQDSGKIEIVGYVNTPGSDSISVKLFKEGVLQKRIVQPLNYISDNAAFSLAVNIHAELAQYSIKFYLDSDSLRKADSLVCGDAYILDGQSNAAAEAYTGYSSPYIRSFGAQQFDNTNIDTGWGKAEPAPQINWQRKNVIGVLGMAIARRIVEDSRIPVAVFNGAIAGTPITYHLRDTALSSIYGRLLHRVVHSGLKDGLRGVIWHQGEAAYSGPNEYLNHLMQLHDSWIQDFPAIQRVFVYQIRPGCNYDGQDIIREAQRKSPFNRSDIRIMSTTNIPYHDGCHYDTAGYRIMGEQMSRIIQREFCNYSDTVGIDAPDIVRAYFRDAYKKQLVLEWTQPVTFTSDSNGHTPSEAFSIGKSWGVVDSVKTDSAAKQTVLYLKSSTDSTTVSYTPDRFYTGTTNPFEGPWLVNGRGIGALTFYRFPITTNGTSVALNRSITSHLTVLASPNPFNKSICIHSAGVDRINVVEILTPAGQIVKRLNMVRSAVFMWDGNSIAGKKVPAGIYICRVKTEKEIATLRIVKTE
ncbi:MAG: T9SS type A sorting domain-containing protein [Fibrobacteres bacterium]|nr:T9SS type A sorting domain-containing protein [Fibrobacterota bacterium]